MDSGRFDLHGWENEAQALGAKGEEDLIPIKAFLLAIPKFSLTLKKGTKEIINQFGLTQSAKFHFVNSFSQLNLCTFTQK